MFKATVAYIGTSDVPEVITQFESKTVLEFSIWLVDAVRYFRGAVKFGGERDISILVDIDGRCQIIDVTKDTGVINF